MSSDHPQPSPADELSFEQALANLENIVRDLEEGQIGLAESLARYEDGIRLLKQCYHILSQAERRIELLSGVDSAGRAQSEPLGDEALSLEEKAQTRSRRRTRVAPDDPTSPEGEIDARRSLF